MYLISDFEIITASSISGRNNYDSD